MGWMMGGTGFGFGPLGLMGGVLNLLVTVGLIVVIVLVAAWLVRAIGPDRGGQSGAREGGASSASPREILQARYARGEITREQYQGMLSDLS